MKQYWRGFVHGRGLRLAVRLLGCHVCMGRKANCDGHAMRSIEFPAMGACLVTEDTQEHRDLFGADGQTTLYWHTPETMVGRVREVISQPDVRTRMTAAISRRITVEQPHRYTDRLNQIQTFLDPKPL